MKKFIIISALSLFLITGLLAIPSVSLAQTSTTNTPAPTQSNPMLNRLKVVGDKGGYVTDPASASAAKMAGRIVKAFINFLGITFILLAVYAGYNWMTAGGNEEAVKKSIATLKQAVIGLIIAVSAWTLWTFVFENLILMQ